MNSSRNNQIKNNLFGQAKAEKKKIAMAVCLLAVMGFMWMRVLTGKEPAAAKASGADTTTGQTQSKVEYDFIELPTVEGRNDVLTRDFFTAGNWDEFIEKGAGKKGGNQQLSILSGNDRSRTAEQIAEQVRVEAVIMSALPQTFINGKLYGLGDKIEVKNGSEVFNCVITDIRQNSVQIKIDDLEVKLKVTNQI